MRRRRGWPGTGGQQRGARSLAAGSAGEGRGARQRSSEGKANPGGVLPRSALPRRSLHLPGRRPLASPKTTVWNRTVTPRGARAGEGIPRLREPGVCDVIAERDDSEKSAKKRRESGSPNPLLLFFSSSCSQIRFLKSSSILLYSWGDYGFDRRVGSSEDGLPAGGNRVSLLYQKCQTCWLSPNHSSVGCVLAL